MASASGFIAIVGRPNVGKSTLMNRLIGEKIAIVSPKPQTTRTRIMGILTQGETQYVFVDTPGLHRPQTRLGDYMVKAVNESVGGVDGAILVVEPGNRIHPEEQELIHSFARRHLPAVLVINKIDTLRQKEALMAQIAMYMEAFPFEAVIPVSAKDGDGVDSIIPELNRFCAPGPHFFDPDAVTDMPEKTLAAEIIREKILRLTDKEIPHGVAVAVESMKERQGKNGPLLDMQATIYCEKDSHKGILIGRQGDMLKRIGSLARRDLERFFDLNVNLQLWIKVKEDWRNRPALLSSFGFDSNDFV